MQLQRVLGASTRCHPFDYSSLEPFTAAHYVALTVNTNNVARPTLDEETPRSLTFEVTLGSLALSAQLLPSLRTKYAARAIVANGRAGINSHFTAELLDHRVRFVVLDAAAANPAATNNDVSTENATSSTTANGTTTRDPIDTFTLPLPYIRAVGRYRHDTSAALTDEGAT